MGVKTDVAIAEAVEIVAVLEEAAAMESRKLLVLDVGGIKPLTFATSILSMKSWQSRGNDGYTPEESIASALRCTEENWHSADICDMPWGWSDNHFDIVWCVDLLNTLRDPIGVVREMVRIGKAGYIRVPSKNFEGLYDVESDSYAGYGMSRWFVECMNTVNNDKPYLLFTYKHPYANDADIYVPDANGEKYLNIWWTGTLDALELHVTDSEGHKALLKYWREEYATQ